MATTPKTLGPREKAKIAFGPAYTASGKNSPLSATQEGMRWVFHNASAWGQAERERVQAQQSEAVARLTRAWEDGSLPLPCQEAIVRACVRPRSWLDSDLQAQLLELGERIAQAPDSQIDWLGAGWEAKAVKTNPGNEAERLRAAQPEWKRLHAKEAPSLLFHWMEAEARARGQSNDAIRETHRYQPPLAALGDDPARAIMAASKPDSEEKSAESWGARFTRNMRQLGAENAHSAAGDQIPLLAAVINNIRHERHPEGMRHWMEWIIKAPQTPWLRFDHAKASWSAEHPLASLGFHQRWTYDPLPYAEATQALLSMGYGPNFEFPEGVPAAAMSTERKNTMPNAVWSFICADATLPSLPQCVEILVRAGADWRQKGGSSAPEHARPAIARVNARARDAGDSGVRPNANLETWEKVFDYFLRLGADPLDALPPPTVHDAAPGRIRQAVGARLEQKALIEGLSQSDVEEALRLLAQKRAEEKTAQGGDEPAASAPRRRPRL